MPKTLKKTLNVLAIETSCDETSVALVRISKASATVLHHEIATQIPVHAIYGGVVPEVAARLHVAETIALLDRAPKKYDAIAVTRGPGLATALRVGIDAGRTLAMITGKPIVGVNHLEGHIASAWLVPENRRHWVFPVLALLVSGGHTELILIKDFGSYRVIGRTRDDAAGEAFDKTAKLMGLGYPGGPVIAERALKGDATMFKLPRPMIHDPSFDFSFSGLKTAVRQTWEGLSSKQRADKKMVNHLCASVQQAIVDVLVFKTLAAVKRYKPRAVCLVGGVSANHHLQESLRATLTQEYPKTFVMHAARGYHTDNAAMIAVAGGWHLLRGKSHDWRRLEAEPELDF